MSDAPIRVLVVDDHPLWREAVARDLTDAGFAVVGTAGDGHQALRVVTATTPALVLLDLQLPGLGGVEVTRALCSSTGPRPFVLVLSASGERRDVLDAMKAGATGYLTKSATREELAAAVGRAGRVSRCSPPASPAWYWASSGSWPRGAPIRRRSGRVATPS